jgi:hypothetical protein
MHQLNLLLIFFQHFLLLLVLVFLGNQVEKSINHFFLLVHLVVMQTPQQVLEAMEVLVDLVLVAAEAVLEVLMLQVVVEKVEMVW